MKPSKRIRRDAARIQEFRNAYVALINASEPVSDFVYTRMQPRIAETEWIRLRNEVARTAGPAGINYLRYGAAFTTFSGPWQRDGVTPTTGWELSLNDVRQLPPETVVGALDAAVARAIAVAEDAEQRERGLTGLIARFLRWPIELREAVGGGPVAQSGALFAGILGQIFVALVAGWIATLIQQLASRLVG